MVKLSDPGQRYEKENVDPRRLTATMLSRRRGSAPVSLPITAPDDSLSSAGGGLCLSETQSLRRGSVPIEIAHYRKYFSCSSKTRFISENNISQITIEIRCLLLKLHIYVYVLRL
jgi:hypothetical protein